MLLNVLRVSYRDHIQWIFRALRSSKLHDLLTFEQSGLFAISLILVSSQVIKANLHSHCLAAKVHATRHASVLLICHSRSSVLISTSIEIIKFTKNIYLSHKLTKPIIM